VSPARFCITSGLCALILGCATCKQPPTVKLAPVDVPANIGAQAYAHVKALCEIGPRPTSSFGWSQSLGYMTQQLVLMGLSPKKDTWIDKLEQIEFTNIRVRIPGKSKQLIVLGCHHDTKNCSGHLDPEHNFRFVGANDSGSGVGLLLELARILKTRNNQASYELVFFDGEECIGWDWDQDRALFGSKRYVRKYQQSLANDETTPPIQAFILLDMVGSKDLQIDDDTNSDQELRDIFYAAAKAQGHEKHFYLSSLPISDDHIPFIEAGIRSIDLIDLDDNDQWHKPSDTLEFISAESLQTVGSTVLTALPELERRFITKQK
jgi:glutaminyl-peptide cyclotransferase